MRQVIKRLLQAGILAGFASTVYAQTQDPVPPDGATNSGTSTSALDAQKKYYEAQTAASNAATAAWNAQKTEIEAKAAADKAKLGTVQGQTTLDGSIQAATTPPKAEALLLVTKATVDTGNIIARRITPFLNARSTRDVILLNDRNQLSVSDAVLFDMKRDLLLEAGRANAARFEHCPVPAAGEAGDGKGRIAAFTAIGTGLELLTKVGSYFQSNFGYGQVDIDVSPDLMAAAVVQSFAAWPTPPKFIVPSHSLASDPTDVLNLLRPLHTQYVDWVSNREIAVKYAEGHKDKNKSAAAACEGAAAAYLKSITAYETFLSGLTADVQGGEPVGIRVVRQKKLQKLLDTKPLILLLTPTEAAAYYTKKNLWTFLGGMPIYTMGGTSVTYALFESGSERELTYGVVAHHGGYRALNKVESLVNRSAAGGAYDARR